MSRLFGIDGTTLANRRGYGRFARGLIPPLIERLGPENVIVFLDPLSRQQAALPAHVRQVVVPVREPPVYAASSEGHRSITDLARMSLAVAERPIDLFFFPSAYTYFPLFRPTRTVVTIHDTIAEHYPHLVFPQRRLEWFWRVKMMLARMQADLVLTVSEASRQAILRQFSLGSQRVQVIPEGPDQVFGPAGDDAAAERVLKRYALSPDDRYLLYVGGVSPHKNLDTLLRAFANLIGHPSFARTRLVLVGDYKGDRFYSCYTQLTALRSELRIREQVAFTGYVPDIDLADLYRHARALVLPSFDEGFGLPVVEAMASGVPVVASARGSLPEVLGGAGRLFDPSSVADLREALATVLGDEQVRAEMVRRGFERASLYNWPRAAAETAAAFESLLDRRR